MSRELRHRLSLLLNLALVFTVLVLVRHKPASTPTVPQMRLEKVADETTLLKQPKPPRHAQIASASDRQSWIEQLRAAGVPNTILARVVLADFEDNWDSRLEECRGDAQKMAALQCEKERNEDAEMRAALGDEGFKQWDEERMLREADVGRIPLTASE